MMYASAYRLVSFPHRNVGNYPLAKPIENIPSLSKLIYDYNNYILIMFLLCVCRHLCKCHSSRHLRANPNIFAKRIPTFLRGFLAYPNIFAKASQHFCENAFYPNIFAEMIDIYDENPRSALSGPCYSLLDSMAFPPSPGLSY